MNSRQTFPVYFYIFMAVLTIRTAGAYTSRPPINSKSTGRRPHERWTMYAPPSTTTSQTAPMIAQKMLKTVGGERGNGWKLSHSVLASCDTLPSFPTARGILSPETVSKMDDMTEGGYGNEAVASFLKTYRQHGPMSCLEMLSDPAILPHLTKAMRDIA
jgi:hypothetical protein